MSFNLTNGALARICRGEEVSEPVVQVLGHKAIQGSGHERYRLLLSDGLYTNNFSMLATHLNYMIHDKHLEMFTILKVKKQVCNQVPNQNKRVVIILELEVVTPGAQVGSKIGNPVQMGSDSTVPSAPATGARCTHCHYHCHPTPVGSGGPIQGSMPRALDALQSICGPNFPVEDLIQDLQGLMARSQSPSAIHAVEPEAVEAELHLAGEGLGHRGVSGRLQRVQRGQTGGSEGSKNL